MNEENTKACLLGDRASEPIRIPSDVRVDGACRQLLAMLCHVLRDRLQALRMAAGRLNATGVSAGSRSRLDSTTTRMQAFVAHAKRGAIASHADGTVALTLAGAPR